MNKLFILVLCLVSIKVLSALFFIVSTVPNVVQRPHLYSLGEKEMCDVYLLYLIEESHMLGCLSLFDCFL